MMNEDKIEKTSFNQPIVYNVTNEGLAMLENKWVSVPDCSDKAGYALVKGGISELKGLRTSVEKRRKELKAESLDYGRRVDITAKEITARIEPLEAKLKSAKQIIDDEKVMLKAEKDRIEKERVDGIKAGIAGITELGNLNYGVTLDEMGERFVAATAINTKAGYDEYAAEAHAERERVIAVLSDAIAAESNRIEEEAERKAEQSRVAEEQRIEREKLEAERDAQRVAQAEFDERNRKAAAEIEAARIEQENAARAERERIEAEQSAKQAVIDLQREEERKADEDRRAAEQRKLDAERAELASQQKKIDDENERQRLAAESKAAEDRRIEAERMNAEALSTNKDEMELAMQENVDLEDYGEWFSRIADAIIAGKIPHVKYEG